MDEDSKYGPASRSWLDRLVEEVSSLVDGVPGPEQRRYAAATVMKVAAKSADEFRSMSSPVLGKMGMMLWTTAEIVAAAKMADLMWEDPLIETSAAIARLPAPLRCLYVVSLLVFKMLYEGYDRAQIMNALWSVLGRHLGERGGQVN